MNEYGLWAKEFELGWAEGSQGVEHQNHPNKIPLKTRQNGQGKEYSK